MTGRWLSALAAAAALGGLLGGCTASGSGTVNTSAVFSDVESLAVGAPVQLADITVGHVSGISLDGDRARVTMVLERSANVPDDVIAELRQTTVLGEYVVSLVPPPGSSARKLVSGETIRQTDVVPGVEQLTQEGAAVFGAVNGAELSQIVAAGAQGFGGQQAQLRQLLNGFADVLTGYAGHSQQIRDVVNQVDQLTTSLSPNAAQNAQAISNLAQTTSVLAQQSARFESLLQALDDLAVQGKAILGSSLNQIEDQLRALAAVATQLDQHQQGLDSLLYWLPGHNAATQSVAVDGFVQILNDLVICGVPGAGSAQNAAQTCNPGGS